MKQVISLLVMFVIMLLGASLKAAPVYFPDANLKARLILQSPNFATDLSGNPIIPDANNDGEIDDVTEAPLIKMLNLSSIGMADITGIEAFTNLENLDVSYNNLVYLNLPWMGNLHYVTASHNLIIYVNLPYNTLFYLDVSYNNISGVFNFNHPALGYLDVSYNSLQELTLSSNPSLNTVHAEHNNLNTVHMPEEPNSIFYFSGSVTYYLNDNHITTLDVSKINSVTTVLNLQNNDLRTLYLNNNVGTSLLSIDNNPDLELICVDAIEGNDIQLLLNQQGMSNVYVSTNCSATQANILEGNVKYDVNNNGCDINDVVVPQLRMSTTDGTTTTYSYTQANGDYRFYAPNGAFTIEPVFSNSSYVSAPANVNTSITGGASQVYDFCLTTNAISHDVSVSMLPVIPARPGFSATYQLVVSNVGSSIQSGTLTLTYDNTKLHSPISTPTSSSASGNQINWSFTNLAPFSTYTVLFEPTVFAPPTVNINEWLAFTCNVSTANTDITPANNTCHLNQIIVGSYDPNDITCAEGASIDVSAVGDYLNYTIRFENTGTYPAQNIVVKNTIDPTKLDLATLIPLTSSHGMSTQIVGNEIQFTFQNIWLGFTPSTNKGFLTYKIKSKSNLVLADVINNQAEIYFDFNPPIITNIASTQVMNTVTTSATACNTYTWSVNGLTYTNAGTYTHTIGATNYVLQLSMQTPPSIVSVSASNACQGEPITVTTNGATQVQWFNGSNVFTPSITNIPATSGITVAGGNGYGSAANQLYYPAGVFVDANGNIYVSDNYNERIQKWAPGATTGTTVAGGNGYGSAANQLDHPYGVFVDAIGNIYVSDTYNERIQKWVPGATTGTTVAGGNGYGSAANQLHQPYGVFVDVIGNIYVSDVQNNRIQKWVPGATTGTTVAGGNGSGSAANQFHSPTGVFVDATGNIYVSDHQNHRIQKWAPGATTGTTVAGGNGYGSAANQLDHPRGVFVDAIGNIYVSDFSNHRIQKWTPGATFGTTIAGNIISGSGANQLEYPNGVFVDAIGNIYVSDNNNHRIQKWSQSQQSTFTPTQPGTYTVVVSNATGCTTTQTVIVTEPSVTASNSNGIIGSSITLSGTPSGGTFSVANPYANTLAGVYPYIYTYTDPVTGCSASASANITITDPNSTTLCLVSTKDAMLHENSPNTNYGTSINQSASRWTYGSNNWKSTRSLFEFDLSNIPSCATITSATLTLKVCPTCSAASYADKHYDLPNTNGNAGIIEAVSSAWTENTVTWNTAPMVGTSNAVNIPSMGNASSANIVSDLTAMVQQMVSSGTNNGFQIRLANNSNYYHILNFATRENPDLSVRPQLCITYTTSNYFEGLASDYCQGDQAATVVPCATVSGFYSGPGITNTGNSVASFDPTTAGSGGSVQYTIPGNTGDLSTKLDVTNHTMFIKSDGSLWAWGVGNTGQLGTNSTGNLFVPTLIDNTKTWKAVSNGNGHTVAITTSGDMYFTGGLPYVYSLTPIGTGITWDKVSAGYGHNVAISTSGQAYGWGSNNNYNLGISPNVNLSVPTLIPGMNNVKEVSCGDGHTLFLKYDGTLYGCGYGADGQFGTSPVIYQSPTQIGTDHDWAFIQAAGSSSYLIKSNGDYYACGWNAFGQLGNGNNVSNLYTLTHIGNKKWKNINVNTYSALGVTTNNELYTWGYNSNGQLGNNTTTNTATPYQVAGNDWAFGKGGIYSSLAVKQNGDIYVTGANSGGQLGLGVSTPEQHQFQPLNLSTGVISPDQVFTQNVIVHPCTPTVDVKLFIQGYYTSASTMQPVLLNQGVGASTTITDYITVELYDQHSPHALVASATATLNTNGSSQANFTGVLPGNYYIAIKSRNGIETWSANPITFTTTANYDFSTAQSQAYGSNLIEVELGLWAIYSGDINQDGFIDSFDFPALDNDIFNGVSGIYVNTDLNGDGFVDSFDFPIFDANSASGVSVIKP